MRETASGRRQAPLNVTSSLDAARELGIRDAQAMDRLLEPIARYYAGKLQAAWRDGARAWIGIPPSCTSVAARLRRDGYTGYDVSPEMTTAAATHASLGNCRFTSHFAHLGVADYTAASGIFNVRLDAAIDTWGRSRARHDRSAVRVQCPRVCLQHADGARRRRSNER